MEFFEIFPWHRNFETGIELIDEQHKKLVDILNQLAAHLANRSHLTTLTNIFAELAEYADYHFRTEEGIWRSHLGNDPWVNEHEKTHANFMTKVSEIQAQQETKPIDEIVQEIVSFLTHWLAYHILDSDKRLALAVLALESGVAMEDAKQQADQKMSGLMKVLIDTVLSMYDTLSSRTLDLMREKAKRRKIEEALKASEERLQAVLEEREGIWDWAMEGEGEASSLELEPLFDMVSMRGEQAMRGGKIHPDDIAALRRALQAYLDGDTEFFVHKYRVIRPDGSWSWILTRGKAVSRDADGGIRRIVGTQTDITERELALLLFNYSSQAMFVTDASMKVIGVNPAFSTITGYGLSNAVGHRARLCAEEKCDNQQQAEIDDGLKMAGYWEGEVVNRRRDGSHFHEYLTLNSVADDAGVVSHYVALFSDISPLKEAENKQRQLEQDLLQAQKMETLGQLTGGIAHDFNNLLAIIDGYSTLTLEQCIRQGDERLTAHMRHVSGATKRATKLVAQMLAFSRSKLEEDSPIQLAPLVKEDIKLLRASLPSTITIRSDIADELPDVVMNPTQLNQILINLAVNARDAMAGEGILTVRLGWARGVDAESSITHQPVSGDWIELAVTDSGTGISPETAAQIFNPFFTTKELGKGTGMGLSVVHGIMRDHSGDILLESEAGKGTTFRMLFKPHFEQRLEVVAEDVSDAEPPRGDGSEILVVDDELSLGIFMSELLKSYGYQAMALADSAVALELYRQDPDRFALLITDQTMPNMTGAQLIEAVRRLRPQQPVILCTGYSDKIDALGAAELDIQFFEKPVDEEALLFAVARLIQAKGASQ